MALYLDDDQTRQVTLKRRDPRPKYFSAALDKQVEIGEDFEAFLILQGQRNQATLAWLEQSKEFGIRDSDRDALAAVALTEDQSDALFSELEILPLIKLFDSFRTGFNMTGFEQVAEAGQLLSDLQRPMTETLNIMDRLKHRQVFGSISLADLGDRALTSARTAQLNSWYGPLTTY